jgi:uncharacterized protein
MKYLLDTSSLIAFGLNRHEFHARVARWVRSQQNSTFHSCSITELGFVRILANRQEYGLTVQQARALLQRLKQDRDFPIEFFADENDISSLPAWVRFSGQTTDGHLAQLARSYRGILATLDSHIPDSFLIP